VDFPSIQKIGRYRPPTSDAPAMHHDDLLGDRQAEGKFNP